MLQQRFRDLKKVEKHWPNTKDRENEMGSQKLLIIA